MWIVLEIESMFLEMALGFAALRGAVLGFSARAHWRNWRMLNWD